MARGRDGLHVRERGILAFSYKDERGVWREKYTGTRDRKEARQFRDNFLEGLRNRSLPNHMADWRMDAAEQWLIEFRTPRVTENTLKSDKYCLHHFRIFLRNPRLREIDNNDLERYVNKRLSDGMSGSTINKEVRLWSFPLRRAKLWRRLEDDYRPLPTTVSDIGVALTRDELRRLSNVAQLNPAWETAYYGFVLAANTGIRGGELKKLQLGAIDIEQRRLMVCRSTTKSNAGARQIELNDDATEAVKGLLSRAYSLGAKNPEHFLFPKNLSRIQNVNGEREDKRGYDPTQHQKDWGTAWNSLRSKAGFPGLRFHDLRQHADLLIMPTTRWETAVWRARIESGVGIIRSEVF